MSKKNCIKPVAAVVGAALVGSLSAINVAGAAENPFGATQLDSGYMVLASSHEGGKEGKCGEGKCGEGKEKMEGKCGGDKEKAEGEKEMEGKCGEGKEKMEGKCGEGKCGGDKEKSEGKCGGK